MEKIYENIRQGKDVRANLIEARKRLKQPSDKAAFQVLIQENPGFLGELLGSEDPKIRKNAALLIGELRLERLKDALYQAYEQEKTLFIRKDYLKALSQMDVRDFQERLQKRLEEMTGQQVPEENQKHYREELSALLRLLLQVQPARKHRFQGMNEPYDVILTTNRSHREVTAHQVQGSRVSLVPLGVKVYQGRLEQLLSIRTFRELLFVLDITNVPADPIMAAEMVAASNLQKLLERAHGMADVFRFRISIVGRMPLDKRSAFIKKCSFTLEQCTGRRLINTPSDYELELRLLERRDGTFLPLVKLYTLKDDRFFYRKESIAASIHPSEAALIAVLAKPYLRAGAQVLDPFCGVGTMLLERDMAVKAGPMYGIDIFGEAIYKARENTNLAKKEIYYINRNFFEFTHEYLFDEIFTNMPVKGKKTREEQEALYQRFFQKAQEVLKPDGIMILYSNEKGYIKKQIRLNESWKLLKEICMNEKEGFSIYIIGQRRQA